MGENKTISDNGNRIVFLHQELLTLQDNDRLSKDLDKQKGKYPNLNCMDVPGWVRMYLIYHGLSPYKFLTVYYNLSTGYYEFK